MDVEVLMVAERDKLVLVFGSVEQVAVAHVPLVAQEQFDGLGVALENKNMHMIYEIRLGIYNIY